MPRKYADYSKTYVYLLTYKTPTIPDSYISYTTNLTQRKYKHKREALDLSYQTKLYECIRKNGGWSNWKCTILEKCACDNENDARERVNSYISKMKPNLNDDNCTVIDELNHSNQPIFPDFKPNIFAGEINATVATPIFEGAAFGGDSHSTLPSIIHRKPTSNNGQYICICKKSYAHRSSYYKHTSTCLQFQHSQSACKNSCPNTDALMNSVSVSIISTTTTTTTTRSTVSALPIINNAEYTEARDRDDNHNRDDDDEDNRIVRYRFKSKKNTDEMHTTTPEVFHYSSLPETTELIMQITEKNDEITNNNHGNEPSQHHSSKHEYEPTDDDDGVSAITGTSSDATSSVVSELLAEQNEKLKDYIRKMISALTTSKKRNKKSLVNSLVFELLDQNKTLQNQIIELSKERNIIVNNTNNNQFNLNFFLNEQCKDAVNLSDFVDSLEITMDDLTYTRNQGLVEGISKVMIDGLKQIDLYKRPIHCTDQKRDTIYVRDNHQWARDEGNARMRQAFVDIANKEYFAIKKWMDLHPGWETNSQLQDFHHKMVRNVLHEIKDDPIGERKIMKSVEREIFIEK
jgi:hypothetical protein